MKKRLLFLGIPTRYVKPTIERAQNIGLEVIIGDSRQHLDEKAPLIAGADQQVVINLENYDELSAMVHALSQETPLDAICTFKEDGAEVVARVVQDYALRGNTPEAIEACNNKYKTHTLLRQAGMPVPDSALCHTSEEAREFWATHPGALILKPHNMLASIGVCKVEAVDDLDASFARCLEQCDEPVVLVEEMVEGREISIEAMVFHGEVVLFGVTEKHLFPGTFIESGHITPDCGEEMTRTQYKQLVQAIVEALGITYGPLHIEGFHTARGFLPTDIHTRYGGDFIVTFTELAMKCDMTTPVLADLADVPYECTFGAPREVAGVRFFHCKPGVIRSITGLEEVRNLPGVAVVELDYRVGDVVRPLRSSFDRVGCVVAKGETRDALEGVFAQAFRLLRVVTE